MNTLWYRWLVRVAGWCGAWMFVLVARVIAAVFFLCSPCRVAEGRRFYQALLPQRGRLFYCRCVFRQFQNFTTIHLDRFLASQGQEIVWTSDGWQHLQAVIGTRGGILIMSHLGNWEMAARALKQQQADLPLLLYMGVKEKEGVERMQKEDLRRSGVTVIGVDQQGGSPLAAVESLRFLREGGLVSLTGDIVWRDDQRRVRVRFLDHDVWLPEAPYLFALLSGAPLFAFFIFRTGRGRYHFSLSEPIVIPPHERRERAAVIAAAAQQYASLLERTLRAHPCEWYHFDRFLHGSVRAPETTADISF
ncbi:MAG: lauroyl acyltransferase [Desulfobulbaceae bacterium A2]|nr:MAG: lauroyl acyltransferase [Desulfobulbaceae bacterium A2]